MLDTILPVRGNVTPLISYLTRKFKSEFNGKICILGLSGGIDSATCLNIAIDALGVIAYSK